MTRPDDHHLMLEEAEEQSHVRPPQPEPEPEPQPESRPQSRPQSRPPSRPLSHHRPKYAPQPTTKLYPRKGWLRPPPSVIHPQKEDLVVMQVDSSKSMSTDEKGCAVIHMFGITEQGNSVLLKVHAFHHYFYLPVPMDIDPKHFMDRVNQRLSDNGICSASLNSPKPVVNVEQVRKRSIMNYYPGDPELKFFKITLLNPRFMKDVSKLLRVGGLKVKRRDGAEMPMPELLTYESNLDYILRFMIEVGLVGCSWLTIPKGKYQIVTGMRKKSRSQIEVNVDADQIIAHQPEGKWLMSAPLRRLSFDIECEGRKGIFPEAKHDSVIQIANYVWNHGEDKPVAQVIFTLKSCAPIVGADVVSFENEGDLLSAWAEFVRLTDPDLFTGYNVVNFDFPYLIDRAEVLKVEDFPYLGRITAEKTTMRSVKMSSSAFGSHESRSFAMQGRIVFDMLQLIIREQKLRSYSLNSVSSEFLGQQKEDVHYSIISDLQRGDEQTRRRLAVYCLKDAMLPIRLMDKLMSLVNYMEMARVTGIPLGWLVSRGHMIKVVSLLHRKSHVVNMLIPDKRSGMSGAMGDDGPKFEGATVIEPERGFYKDPIATLDFASLYPSIIMAHNLCYSTLVDPKHLSRIKPADVEKTPSGSYFVKKGVKTGILTKMLEELLSARKQAKKDLKAAKDPFLKSVLNGRQLALKISANAVYGFTGATVGKLPCMAISASTTAYGRQMIQMTKDEVEKRYPGAKVIYGDTDSVMIKFGAGKKLGECMSLGEEAASAISELFPKPVKLEFEKCYYPYLLVSKKRYAGLLWTETAKYDKMDCKGIESVRRDNCRLVANVISMVLELLLKKRNEQAAKEMVKKTISELLQNKIDISLLVVSKALTKVNYENKQAHAELAIKMRKRDAGTAPNVGDRVPYVITKGTKNAPAYARAEDPLYVLENNIPIDNEYYVENMLRKPLERIFEPVMGKKVSSLFAGEHTRSVFVAMPKNSMLAKFAKKGLTCLGCKSPIEKGSVCPYCLPREPELYMKQLETTTKLEQAYASLWTECQRCMGEVCQDVLCSNGDCPIFYRRRKAQKDLDTASSKLTRFDIEWKPTKEVEAVSKKLGGLEW